MTATTTELEKTRRRRKLPGECMGQAGRSRGTITQVEANVFLPRTDLWRKMSIYIVITCLCIAGVNAWRLWGEHWEHKSHEPIEDRVEMPFMNIRTKNYFWGDGDKVGLCSHIRRCLGSEVLIANLLVPRRHCSGTRASTSTRSQKSRGLVERVARWSGVFHFQCYICEGPRM